MPYVKTCLKCGIEFSTKDKRQSYCSRDCFRHDQSRIAKEQWQDPEFRAHIMKGIGRRSESEEWKSAAHFQRGEQHPRYKGARDARKDMSRYEYKKWRTDVFYRDGYTCQDCGQHGGKLVAHHVNAWADYPDLRFDVANGQTLCESCHDIRHGLKRRSKTYHCVDCGRAKTDGRGLRCSSCASKAKYDPTKRVKPKACAYCGQQFLPKKPSIRYCCVDCQHGATRKERVVYHCAQCGGEVFRLPSAVREKVFCGKECKTIYCRGKPRNKKA